MLPQQGAPPPRNHRPPTTAPNALQDAGTPAFAAS